MTEIASQTPSFFCLASYAGACIKVSFTNEKPAFTGSLAGDLVLVGSTWADVISVFLGNSLHVSAGVVSVSVFYFVPHQSSNDVLCCHFVWVEKEGAALSVFCNHSRNRNLHLPFVSAFRLHQSHCVLEMYHKPNKHFFIHSFVNPRKD